MKSLCVNLVAAFVAIVASACTQPNPAATCMTGQCSDPAFPFCDADGVVSGNAGACIAVSCTPGEILKCVDNAALTCSASGSAYERVACDLGCKSDPQPHCGYIEPKYLPDVCDMPTTQPEVSFTNVVATLDPNLDTSCTGGIIPQTGAADICVVRYRSITIGASAKLKVSGSWIPAGRAIALISDGPLRVDGMLDVSAKGSLNGPGAALTPNGLPPRITQNPGDKLGGGGSGGQTNGAPGGSNTTKGGAQNGGPLLSDPALLTAFVGGAPAYKNSRSTDSNGALGGGGGGALMLVSCRDTVTITGTISAGGGGGDGGADALGIPFPGNGGGAGGYVVIQAKQIDVSGQLFANGGSGGYGRLANGATGDKGLDGCLSDAFDGTCGVTSAPKNGEGAGGRGGIGTSPPTAGDKPTDPTNAAAGGGGGSVGFLQTYTPGTAPTLNPTKVAPAFQPNGTINVR